MALCYQLKKKNHLQQFFGNMLENKPSDEAGINYCAGGSGKPLKYATLTNALISQRCGSHFVRRELWG